MQFTQKGGCKERSGGLRNMGKSTDGSWGSSMRLDGQKIHRANHRMYIEIKFQFEGATIYEVFIFAWTREKTRQLE